MPPPIPITTKSAPIWSCVWALEPFCMRENGKREDLRIVTSFDFFFSCRWTKISGLHVYSLPSPLCRGSPWSVFSLQPQTQTASDGCGLFWHLSDQRRDVSIRQLAWTTPYIRRQGETTNKVTFPPRIIRWKAEEVLGNFDHGCILKTLTRRGAIKTQWRLLCWSQIAAGRFFLYCKGFVKQTSESLHSKVSEKRKIYVLHFLLLPDFRTASLYKFIHNSFVVYEFVDCLLVLCYCLLFLL